MTRIAFHDSSGGHDSPSLVYHLAHMLADQGQRTLILDLDPTSRLTAMCVSEDRLSELWQHDDDATISGYVLGLFTPANDPPQPKLEDLRPGLALLPGDLALALFEERLAWAWSRGDEPGAIVVSSILDRATSLAEQTHAADIVLMNLGTGLGAINRAALLAADHVITPVAPDLTSVHGLHVLGPELTHWRADWQACTTSPLGQARPLGYIVTTPAIALNQRSRARALYLQIPTVFRNAWRLTSEPVSDPATDPWCLGLMREYPGLRMLAQEARRPMFDLRPADGAIGAHMTSVVRCREDFDRLARTLLARANTPTS